MGANVSAPSVVNISDLRAIAKKRLPQMVFDYIDSGADREQTLDQNCSAYKEILFRPRCAVDTPSCNLGINVLGQEFQLPFLQFFHKVKKFYDQQIVNVCLQFL